MNLKKYLNYKKTVFFPKCVEKKQTTEAPAAQEVGGLISDCSSLRRLQSKYPWTRY